MEASSSLLMSPMTAEMSAGFGVSSRMASAMAAMQATRPANSSAGRVGLHRPIKRAAPAARGRGTPGAAGRAKSGVHRIVNPLQPLQAAGGVLFDGGESDARAGAEGRRAVHRLPQFLDQLLLVLDRGLRRPCPRRRWPAPFPARRTRWRNPRSRRCACRGRPGSRARWSASACDSASACRDTPSNNSARRSRSATWRTRTRAAAGRSVSLNFSSSGGCDSFIRLRCGTMSRPSFFICSISFWPGDTMSAMSVVVQHRAAALEAPAARSRFGLCRSRLVGRRQLLSRTRSRSACPMLPHLVVHLERRGLVDGHHHRLADEAAPEKMPHDVLAPPSPAGRRG